MSTVIERLPRLRLSQVKVAEFVAGRIKEAYFDLWGLSYRITYEEERAALLFKWTDQGGEVRKVRVKIQEERSNLGRGSVYYFLCPVTGERCRKLFLDGKVICSRRAFRHHYELQEGTKLDRAYIRLRKLMGAEEKSRKAYYRGRLTPYGRKLLRDEAKFDSVFETISAAPLRGRGRPRKEPPPYVPKLFFE